MVGGISGLGGRNLEEMSGGGKGEKIDKTLAKLLKIKIPGSESAGTGTNTQDRVTLSSEATE